MRLDPKGLWIWALRPMLKSPFSEFSPKVGQVDKAGWSLICLGRKSYYLKNKFDVINEGEEAQKTMVIPFQNQSSEKIFAAFYNTGGSIGILNKRKDHFAVVLEYFTD